MKTAALLVLIVQTLFLTAVAGLLLHLLLPQIVTAAHVIIAVIFLPVFAGIVFVAIVPTGAK